MNIEQRLYQSYSTPTKAFVYAYAEEARISPLEAERTLVNARQDTDLSGEEILEVLKRDYPDIEDTLEGWEMIEQAKKS